MHLPILEKKKKPEEKKTEEIPAEVRFTRELEEEKAKPAKKKK